MKGEEFARDCILRHLKRILNQLVKARSFPVCDRDRQALRHPLQAQIVDRPLGPDGDFLVGRTRSNPGSGGNDRRGAAALPRANGDPIPLRIRHLSSGMTLAEVEAFLGSPQTRIDPGEKVLLNTATCL